MKQVIKVGGVFEHFNLPWIQLSEEKNSSDLFSIEWKSFAGGTGVLTSALKNGEIDIAVLLTEGLIIDILQNNLLSLVCFHVNNPLRWGIHIRTSDNNPNFSFENKKFAISRFGSGSHTMAKLLLNKQDISYRESLMVEVGSLNGGLESLKNKTSDVFLWEKFTTEPLLNDFHLDCIDEVLTPWPPFSVATTKYFKKENATLLNEILIQVRNNASQILNDPNSIQELNNRWKINPKNAERWLHEIQWNDHQNFTDKDLASILKHMKAATLIEESVSPNFNVI